MRSSNRCQGRRRYWDTWRTVKYEEAYLKAYMGAGEARRGLEAYFRLYNDLRPHQALGYRTPAEVVHGAQAVREEEAIERRCAPGEVPETLTGAAGLSLNSPPVLSK